MTSQTFEVPQQVLFLAKTPPPKKKTKQKNNSTQYKNFPRDLDHAPHAHRHTHTK